MAWLVVATLVGLLIGRMIRERDRQVPPPDAARDTRMTEETQEGGKPRVSSRRRSRKT